MQLENELRLSYYKELGCIDQAHGVRLVQHVESQRVFVLKTLHIYDRRIFQYLKEHPRAGVPHIEELIEDEGTLYVIEEYISGSSLRELLDRTGPLPEQAALDLIRQLCHILAPLHRQQPPVVHRDIKPSNLIIRYSGEAVLVDFNSAKKADSRRTRDTVLIGTAGYAAPEQYGFQSSQPTADIYAMGVLLNELLTGAMPQEKLCQGRLRSVVETCLQIDPSNRYQTVEALLRDLDALERPAAAPTVREKRALLPPGFRSGRPAAMLVGALWYTLTAYVSLSLQVEGASAPVLFLNRALCLLICLIGTLWFGNYLNVWDTMPLASSPRRGTRLLGVALWGVLLITGTFTTGVMLISLLSGG